MGEGIVRLTFDLDLPELLYRALIDRCRDCSCSPKQYAAEAVEAQVAAHLLSTLPEAPHGAQLGGRRAEHEDEGEEMEPEGYPVHCPEGISDTQE
jgi:hypothetical protein